MKDKLGDTDSALKAKRYKEQPNKYQTYVDEIAELKAENEDLHNCLTRCWKALGTETTLIVDKEISEHIADLKAENERLKEFKQQYFSNYI